MQLTNMIFGNYLSTYFLELTYFLKLWNFLSMRNFIPSLPYLNTFNLFQLVLQAPKVKSNYLTCFFKCKYGIDICIWVEYIDELNIPVEWVLFRLWDTNGVIFSFSGKAILVEIFLCCLVLCSNLFKWKLATIGSFFMVNCLVDSAKK